MKKNSPYFFFQSRQTHLKAIYACFLCLFFASALSAQLRTYLNLGFGAKHALDYYNDPAMQLTTTGLRLNIAYACRCGNQAVTFGVVQEISKNMALELNYRKYYKNFSIGPSKPFYGYGSSILHDVEKMSLKLSRTWHFTKHWQLNTGIGYQVLWSEAFLDRSGFTSNVVDDVITQQVVLTEEEIKAGYEQLLMNGSTEYNKYEVYHLLTASTALEYKLKNNLTFYVEGAFDYGFRHITNTNIVYRINTGPTYKAQIWDTGNAWYWYFGTKLPVDWLWHNGYVKELFKK